MKKFFQNSSKKSLRGDHRTKGGTIGKKFFRNVFLLVQNDCFDERKHVLDGFKAIRSRKKFSLKLVEKKFKG